MTNQDSRYTMKIDVVLLDEAGSSQMMENHLEYNELRYEHVLHMEGLLVDLLAKLNEYGQQSVAGVSPGKK